MPLREGAGRPIVGADSETKNSGQLNCSAVLSRFLPFLNENTRNWLRTMDGALKERTIDPKDRSWRTNERRVVVNDFQCPIPKIEWRFLALLPIRKSSQLKTQGERSEQQHFRGGGKRALQFRADEMDVARQKPRKLRPKTKNQLRRGRGWRKKREG